jgi:hypothetical protein
MSLYTLSGTAPLLHSKQPDGLAISESADAKLLALLVLQLQEQLAILKRPLLAILKA